MEITIEMLHFPISRIKHYMNVIMKVVCALNWFGLHGYLGSGDVAELAFLADIACLAGIACIADIAYLAKLAG